MKRLAVAVSGIAVVVVVTVVTVVVWRASEPPARSDTPRAPQQQEPAPPEPRAVVVSGTDPEGIVLGELYAQALDRSGFSVEHEWGSGALSGPAEALDEGGDATVGYSDTGAPLGDAPEGIEMLAPSPDARSEHVVVTTRATAERHGLSDVADLPGVPSVRVASVSAAEDDPLTALWPLLPPPAGPDDFRPVDASEAAMLLREGEVDAAVMESFEGRIVADDLVVLDDAERNIVADDGRYPAPVVRTAFVGEHLDAREALGGVSRSISTEDVRDLVAATEAAGGDPSGPVANYYEEEVSGG